MQSIRNDLLRQPEGQGTAHARQHKSLFTLIKIYVSVHQKTIFFRVIPSGPVRTSGVSVTIHSSDPQSNRETPHAETAPSCDLKTVLKSLKYFSVKELDEVRKKSRKNSENPRRRSWQRFRDFPVYKRTKQNVSFVK
jgi:hypothetical protein